MDICTQFARYGRFCKAHGITPQSFARFVVDVFPFTTF